MAEHSGWKPEGFMRKKLTLTDVQEILEEVKNRAEQHFRDYGDGIFCHPQEVVGCMLGQLIKLSAAADASIYTGDLVDFRERCVKTLFAMFCGTMSIDKLAELRAKANE